MSGFKVVQPGLLTLIQDRGRFGYHGIGLTNGGPMDPWAFRWANRLCSNDESLTALEVSIGGLVLEAQVSTVIAVCGAAMPLKINGTAQALWRTHQVNPGDRIELGFATDGARAYLAVAGGFHVAPMFGSTATVAREAVGGLNGGKLQQGDQLSCSASADVPLLKLPDELIPTYGKSARLRVVLGYQQDSFSAVQQQLFFSSEYQLTDKADRMGFRLQGQPIQSTLNGILSEGICHGAIQIPADGQPIVLLNDRQTIGGYPKIGSVIAEDSARLAQLMPGATIRFELIDAADAHALLCLNERKFIHTQAQRIS